MSFQTTNRYEYKIKHDQHPSKFISSGMTVASHVLNWLNFEYRWLCSKLVTKTMGIVRIRSRSHPSSSASVCLYISLCVQSCLFHWHCKHGPGLEFLFFVGSLAHRNHPLEIDKNGIFRQRRLLRPLEWLIVNCLPDYEETAVGLVI